MTTMVQVRYTRPNTHTNQFFTLMPGINEVDAELVSKAQALPGFQRRVKDGLIVVMAQPLEEDAVVSEMTDVAALRKVAKGRSAKAKAAKARLAEIDAQDKARAEPEAGDSPEGAGADDDNEY
jgi:hypothetical protein